MPSLFPLPDPQAPTESLWLDAIIRHTTELREAKRALLLLRNNRKRDITWHQEVVRLTRLRDTAQRKLTYCRRHYDRLTRGMGRTAKLRALSSEREKLQQAVDRFCESLPTEQDVSAQERLMLVVIGHLNEYSLLAGAIRPDPPAPPGE